MTDPIPNDATADEGTTNDERASWAEVALLAYGQRTGTVGDKVGDDEDPSVIITDLLADVAHWCDRNNVDLQSALASAAKYYQTETGGEGRQLRP
jgi:hypothetical protein